MILFFDIFPYNKKLEYNQTITCQQCGHFGRYEVYVVANRFRLFFIPLFTFGKRYAVRTTCCDSLYQLIPEKGQGIANGQTTIILEEDLVLQERGTPVATSQCQHCGQSH